MFHDRKAVSPVVGVVILAGVGTMVAIAFAVALSAWMGSTSTSGTAFATLKVQSSYAYRNNTSEKGSGWLVKIHLKNSGSANSSINDILINGKPLEEYSNNVHLFTELPLRVNSGNSETVIFKLEESNRFNAGIVIKVELFSSSGASLTRQIDLK